MLNRRAQLFFILLMASAVGIAAGLFGVGGGVLLVPLLVLLFKFPQHTAQGTSLTALVAPVGLLAFLNYQHHHAVNWTVGLLIMPGIFVGGLLGGKLAHKISPRRMRQAFAVFLFAIGVWQIVSAWLMHASASH